MTRIGSLFSGYGGLDMAVESVVGGTLAWYSEIEPAACKVLAAHHPGVPNLGDITTVDWSCVEPVEVLTGGYPCQPFSHAGQRKGKADERHLYPYVSAAIGALQPRLVVLENVAGHRSLGLADVLLDLASLGYDVRWGSVRAADAGAPHGRERVFITAHPHRAGLQGADARLDVAAGRRYAGGHPAESTHGTPADAVSERHDGLGDSDCEGSPRGGRANAAGHSRTSPDAAISGSRACGPQGASEARPAAGLGRDVQPPADADRDGHGIQLHPGAVGGVEGEAAGDARERQRARRVPHAGSDLAAADADSAAGTERDKRQAAGSGLQLGDDIAGRDLRGRNRTVDWGKYTIAIGRWESILGRPAPDPTTPGANGRPRLSPHFVEWMMGLPVGHVTGHGLSAAQSLKMLGNGVCPQQATLALRMLAVA